MKQSEWLAQAATQLEDHPSPAPVLVGFDGFVDEILHLVDERTGPESFIRMADMAALAKRIKQAVDLSCNIELVPKMVKLGGNAPILANALTVLDHPTAYIGAIGREEILPVFRELAEACVHVTSLADPAFTHALEFTNGKILFGKMDSLKEVNWDRLVRLLPEDRLSELLAGSQLVACVNWTMLVFMNEILTGLGRLLGQLAERRYLFIDLTDPKKRSREDLAEVLDLLSGLQASADVVLGMNKNESDQVATVLGVASTHDLQFRAEGIRNRLDIHLVVIHPADSAYAASETDSWHVHGPYTASPQLTTGAGDVFNSGFCHALLAGCAPREALGTGVCASGFYVRNCRPASREELIGFMRRWAAVDCGNLP